MHALHTNLYRETLKSPLLSINEVQLLASNRLHDFYKNQLEIEVKESIGPGKVLTVVNGLTLANHDCLISNSKNMSFLPFSLGKPLQ